LRFGFYYYFNKIKNTVASLALARLRQCNREQGTGESLVCTKPQAKGVYLNKDELLTTFLNLMKSETKIIDYIQIRFRSAT
jgi:hypothetical protein